MPGPGRPRKPITHGTIGGYSAHRRRGEDPCIECKEARSAYNREHSKTYVPPPEVLERKRARKRERDRQLNQDPEHRERVRRYNREWARKHREDPEYREKSNERNRECDRRRRLEDPEYRETRNAHSREYMARTWADPDGRERLQTTKRRYEVSDKGRERSRAYSREYFREARKRIGSSVRTRELAKRDRERYGGKVPGVPTSGTLQDRLDYYGGKCWMCGADTYGVGLHWDHVKPLSKGGADALCNLRPSCPTCNMSKGNTWPYTRSELP